MDPSIPDPPVPSALPEAESLDTNVLNNARTGQAPSNYWGEVVKQVTALLKKNFILGKRNWVTTCLRLLSSFFFILLIFGVNEGIQIRTREEAYNKDITSPEPKMIEGIPACVPKYGKTSCFTLAYTPAPVNQFKPDKDYATLNAFVESSTDATSLCTKTGNGGGVCSDCDSTPQEQGCKACCEAFRVSKIVRGIMANNGTEVRQPIPVDKVIGFTSPLEMDKYLLANPETVQGAYIFHSPDSRTVTMTLQQNSTSTAVRGEWTRPFFSVTVPMQVMAQREIAQQIHFSEGEEADMQVLLSEFAHPALDVTSFEGAIAPLFLLACAMFPFAIQMSEVVVEKELKLRQALSSMGLHDLSYWLSWHVYQSVMSFLSAFFIYCFGCIFQLRMFLKNDFGVLLCTFWFFAQAMVGFAFFVGALISRSSSAVMVGFSTFLLGFLLYFMVIPFGFPYGTVSMTQSFSYERDIVSGNYTWKDNSDPIWEPLFAFVPPTLLIKSVGDLGSLSASDKDDGLRFSERYSYCYKEVLCNPSYSIGTAWSWMIGLYFMYSILGLYLENVLPDAMGVRKPPWYFLLPSYWGFGNANVVDKVEEIETSTDEDVMAEEALLKGRLNQPMHPDSALEIRGLRQTFTRSRTPFHAVKAPWYAVGRKQLFALLGPNGAGKTTTINMLTGSLPPSAGNALVLGQTVAHPSGMQAVKKMMGVCPQFDILWENLTAREHLALFGVIKGISPDSLANEVTKRLEEVRLMYVENQTAGTFSGGMKRRLSVAVALIGGPQIVYLDEPTTGMDPISRRHVWDVIEAAKQDRTVILTTHSMEEADILGDRIAIMAKGRLRCLGNSVRLKTRFGAGYKVSVSCGEKMKQDSASAMQVKEVFKKGFDIEPVEVTHNYMHFEVPKVSDAEMTNLFMELEARRAEPGVTDVQLSMSTLEDVFLSIAAQAEKEAAASTPVEITLKTGEVVAVPLGQEEEAQSPQGILFKVKWGTDEDGNLMAVDTIETKMEEHTIQVTVPPGVDPGQQVQVACRGQNFSVAVPEGMKEGDQFNATVMVKSDEANRGAVSATTEEVRVRMSAEEVQERVDRLKTPFSKQADALFRKNMTLQSKKCCTNCCLLLVPFFFIVLLLLLQMLIEVVFLGQPFVRCPYCGPADSYAKDYCRGNNCTDWFFPEDDRASFIARFGEDPRPICNELAATCPGDGHDSCFLTRFARDIQMAFCPLPFGVSQPSYHYNTPPPFRSDTPVIFSGEDFASDIADRMYDNTETKKKLQGAADAVTHTLFNAMFGLTSDTSCHGTITDTTQQAGLCKLLQHGSSAPRACCRDLSTDDDITPGFATGDAEFSGSLVSGVNYWAPDAGTHNDVVYAEALEACLNVTGTTVQSCNADIRADWIQNGGVMFATGEGRSELVGTLLRLDVTQLLPLLLGGAGDVDPETMQSFNELGFMDMLEDATSESLLSDFGTLIERLFAVPNADAGEDKFWCVNAEYSAAAADALPEDQCINLEEGLALLAWAESMPATAHYQIEPGSDVESITLDDTEYFADTGGRWAQTCDWYRVAPDVEVPCLCNWLLTARMLTQAIAFPSGSSRSGNDMDLPLPYDCPRDATSGAYRCLMSTNMLSPMSMSELAWSSHVRPSFSFFLENAYVRDEASWWSQPHVLEKKQKEDFSSEFEADQNGVNCSTTETCWVGQHFEETGRMLLMARDCTEFAAEACYLQRLLNLTGVFFECASSAPARLSGKEQVDKRLYEGHWDRYDDTEDFMEEFIAAYDFHDSSASKLKMTVMYNDTTELYGGGGGGPRINPRGIFSGILAGMEAYVNAKLGTTEEQRVVIAAMGLKEMPKPANFLTLDFGSLLGPFFFTLAFSMLFPTIVVALVYEKEQRLRVMMRMMGLGTSAYWLINYLFWLLVFSLFVLIFVAIGSLISLPSGYNIGLFTRTAGSVHFVLFFLFINNTLSLAILWATCLRSARVAQVSSILFVLTMCMIAWSAWDFGNFYNSETISTDTKNFITVFPFWNFYRAWNEYREYAFQSAYLGTPGLGWDQISNDPRCGMDAVLVALFLEWPFFLFLALYLDQILDSGHGVPQHPLFCIGKTFQATVENAPGDVEAEGGNGVVDMEDVKAEAARVTELLNGPTNLRDAVMIQGLNKIYPARMGAPAKEAVKTLTMGVQHGECFGMLGPNGAGKTTTINMLIGFAQPTKGTAFVENFDIRTDMARIYSLMGVCPQHEILWETLTARQHMLFYGRLKNLSGEELKSAVAEGLKAVNLHTVMDQKAGTFSGGMKRRLSVAISMIGSPLACYLDEPSTGLDPASRRTLWGVIKEAKKSRAIFLTTHSMEEAEGLCDRLGIFVDGQLRCVGSPKTLTQQFGGFYVLTIHSDPSKDRQVSDMVHSMARDCRITYGLAGTQKFEIPSDQITLSQVFRTMTQHLEPLAIKDWGIANTTLEEAFIKISKGAVGT